MARIPFVNRDSLAPEARRLYGRVGETRGSVINLYKILFNSPGAAGPISALGEYIRYKSPLDPLVREIAILTTAQELGVA